jgi:hypothetical protein
MPSWIERNAICSEVCIFKEISIFVQEIVFFESFLYVHFIINKNCWVIT